MQAILTYHHIGSSLGLGIGSVKPKAFIEHVHLLRRLGLRSVPVTQVLENDDDTLISITFDDGYASVYEIALPVMLSAGFKGSVFPVVGAIGGTNSWDVRLSLNSLKHLGWDDVRYLAEHGFEIGSHTVTHSDLTRLSRKRLRWELRVSKAMLEDKLGIPVTAIAYPFGKCSQEVIEEALDAGYTYGFLSYFTGSSEPMRLGRFSVYSIDTLSTLRSKLGLGRGRRIEILKCRVISWLSRGTPLVKRGQHLVF